MFSITIVTILSFLLPDTYSYLEEKKKLVFEAKLDPLSVRFTYGKVNGAAADSNVALHTIRRDVERELTEIFQREASTMGVDPSNPISVLVMYEPLHCSANLARNEENELCQAHNGYCCDVVNGVVIAIASPKATVSMRVPTEYKKATVVVRIWSTHIANLPEEKVKGLIEAAADKLWKSGIVLVLQKRE